MCITLSLLTDNVKCTSNAQTDHNTEVKAKLRHPIGTFAIPCKYQQDLGIKPVEWTTTLSTHMDVQQMPRWLKQLGRKPAVTLTPEPHQYMVFMEKIITGQHKH